MSKAKALSRVPRGIRKVKVRHLIYGALITLLLFMSAESLVALSPYKPHAATQYFRAKVTSVQAIESGQMQAIHAQLQDGPNKGQVVFTTRSISFGDTGYKRLPVGSIILLSKEQSNGNLYSFISRWYMPGLATLCIILLALVVLIGAWRGITSIFGLCISILILTVFVVPQVMKGKPAFATCIVAAVIITFVSLYIAHGVSKRTTVALAGSLIALLMVVGLTAFAVYVSGTSEVIDEGNVGILYASQPIDVSGLLTGGIVIASLGTLFDITTGQAAAVDEIYTANRSQSTRQVFYKGMSVGREHIAALINTLALVYAGVALPAIITTAIVAQSYRQVPLLVNLNTETIAEEVVRTIVASIALLLALPLTTLLAAYILPRWNHDADLRFKRWLKSL